MIAAGGKDPTLEEIVAPIQGKFQQASRVRTDDGGKIVVRQLRSGDARGAHPDRKEPVNGKHDVGNITAGIADGDLSFIHCFPDQLVCGFLQQFRKPFVHIHDMILCLP